MCSLYAKADSEKTQQELLIMLKRTRDSRFAEADSAIEEET
jgi:hypothetical protein